VSNAGSTEEIWNTDGEVLALIDESELNESVRGRNGNQNGDGNDKRGLAWRQDGPGLVFLQLEPRQEEEEDTAADADVADAGQQATEEEESPRLDRVMYWLPPFDDTATQVVYETEDRIQSARFDESGRLLFLTRRDGNTETVHAVDLDAPDREYLIYEEDTDDIRGDQGSLMSDQGGVHVTPDGRFVFLSGTQYFEDPLEDAPRPFLDRVEIRTGEKTRIFESGPAAYETVSTVMNDEVSELLVSRESPTRVPNQWLVNLTSGAERQVTFNEDRHPLITAARREVFTVTRADGFESRVTVTLPHDYVEGTRLPAMFWF